MVQVKWRKCNKICTYTFGVRNDENDSEWVCDLNNSFLKSLVLNNYGFINKLNRKQLIHNFYSISRCY